VNIEAVVSTTQQAAEVLRFPG
jgi:oligosaccharyltransferase complex subunit alpha (ribophorin I)